MEKNNVETVNKYAGKKMIGEQVYQNLPPILQRLTSPFTGREKDIVLLSSLGVLSNCLPKVYGAYDGRTVYPHLYILIIAPPASGKGVMNYSRLLIEPIHDRILSTSKLEKKQCEEEKKNSKETDFSSCPKIVIKILPANCSVAQMYAHLENAPEGLLIIESEADTLSIMLKNDWSNSSDVLRKAFHHESISLTRKTEDVFLEVKEPKLALVISGTPNQLQSLLKDKENGLFSRFMMYSFDEISQFKNVFDTTSNSVVPIFKEIGAIILDMYDKLSELQNPILFDLTENQKQSFLQKFNTTHNYIVNRNHEDFISNLNRHGLIAYRIAMILSVLRNSERFQNQQTIFCNDIDFQSAIDITFISLSHTGHIFLDMDNNRGISTQDSIILDALPNQFTRKQAVEIAKKQDIASRTIDNKLVKWCNRKILKKQSQGTYQKT